MVLANAIKCQHFLSQVEQRRNTINPNTPKEIQKIYSFSVIDRENYLIRLDSERGSKIKNNLSFLDLFSFDVVNKNLRYNYEKIFSQYECNGEMHTKNLLDKLVNKTSLDIKDEIINIFIAKELNFLRNPYNIKKVLNTIGVINKYYPTNPELSSTYKKLIEGNRPHQKYVCSSFGISESEYQEWLHAIFMLLYPELNQSNPLEDIANQLFEQDSHFVTVTVFNYTGEHEDKRCLLSDRGFSTPLPEDKYLSYAYNLCSNAFILYIFVDIEVYVPKISPNRIDLYKRSPKRVHVNYKENDLEALSIYNRNVVYQSHSKVYSSSKYVYGLK
jgi:hypothetical protein